MAPPLREAVRGMLLAGAVGDALGAPIEFQALAEIRRAHGPLGPDAYVEFGDGTGSVTDDTQMTLFTAEGLLRARSAQATTGLADPVASLWDAYRRWRWTQGSPHVGTRPDGWLSSERALWRRRAPGNTCLSALGGRGPGAPDRPVNQSKGCGGVMRIAPFALWGDEAFEGASEAAAITHGHPTGWIAAGALAAVLARCLAGDSLESAVAFARRRTRTRKGCDETLRALDGAVEAAQTRPAEPESVERLGAGWTAEEALAIGLFCAWSAKDLRSALRLAACHTGDSDSTASIAGQILGALHGERAVPKDLLAGLRERDLVSRVADDLLAGLVPGAPYVPDLGRYPPT